MVFIDALPIEMRGASIVSFIMFSILAIAIWCFYQRITKLEGVVMERTNEISRLTETLDNLDEKIGWIREDIKSYNSSVDKSMSEIRKNMYGK